MNGPAKYNLHPNVAGRNGRYGPPAAVVRQYPQFVVDLEPGKQEGCHESTSLFNAGSLFVDRFGRGRRRYRRVAGTYPLLGY